MAQTGDPTGTGKGGESIFGYVSIGLYGENWISKLYLILISLF